MATANALLGCTSDDSLQLPLGTSNLTPIYRQIVTESLAINDSPACLKITVNTANH